MLAGNFYEREVETTRSDAGIGQVLLENGQMEFKPVHPLTTGLMARYDARAVGMVKDSGGTPLIIVANNSIPVQVFRKN